MFANRENLAIHSTSDSATATSHLYVRETTGLLTAARLAMLHQGAEENAVATYAERFAHQLLAIYGHERKFTVQVAADVREDVARVLVASGCEVVRLPSGALDVTCPHPDAGPLTA